RQIATRRVKAQLAAQGIKLYEVKARDITRLANAYLNQHGELLAEADAKIEAGPELRKLAEREQRRQQRLTATAAGGPGREASPAKPCAASIDCASASRSKRQFCGLYRKRLSGTAGKGQRSQSHFNSIFGLQKSFDNCTGRPDETSCHLPSR